MAKKETNVSQWVDERLAALDAGEWQPDSERGLARFRDRRRTARRHMFEWIMAAVATTFACAALMVFSSPGACARPNGCSSDGPRPVAPAAARPADPPVPAPPPAAAVAETAKPKPEPPPAGNFKESGSPAAPVVFEIYSDYECPSCALFYRESMPPLMDHYVRTGKLRLIHRDFPLQAHPYARLAARYANAAGALGQYDTVVRQLFQTQILWTRDGNIDAQVMQVLAPGDMQRVREMVTGDPHLDDTVTLDMAKAVADHVDRTPFLVVVTGGKRQSVGGAPKFSFLKTYLDQVLPAR
jgi:protein-disulfide isomerase